MKMSTKGKVYTFYTILILSSLTTLVVFPLNLYAKFVLISLSLLCAAIMWSVWKAPLVPDEEEQKLEEEDENE